MITVAEISLHEAAPWRDRYRLEMACQIVHDSWHARGRTRLWRLERGGSPVGYLATAEDSEDQTVTVKELWVEPGDREALDEALRAGIGASGATHIAAQTNDPILAPLLPRFAEEIERPTWLFRDGGPTPEARAGSGVVRRLTPSQRDSAFVHTSEPVGDWGVLVGEEVVGTAGYFTHYNPPYADVYMEVAPGHRRRGYGALAVWHVMAECRRLGLIPAARCSVQNDASRRTLLRAGFELAGAIERGRIRFA